MPPIPAYVRANIFPSPNLSIASFLRFPFPSQLPKSSIEKNIHLFWSSEKPNVLEFSTETLQHLPIPSASVLSSLEATAPLFQEKLSMVYAHLPNRQQSYYPLWILNYWTTVSSLYEHVKHPWIMAESFLSASSSKWKASPAFRKLSQSAQNMLLGLPWAGGVHGFSDNAPTVVLASYLSKDWLSTSHICQQLDLLRQELVRVGNQDYIILGPDFFEKLRCLYEARKENSYPASGGRWIVGVGNDLATLARGGIGGVANVKRNHWVTIIVDVHDRKIRYGDSLGGMGTELKTVVRWWIESHTSSLHFDDESLDISRQSDNFNCSSFSLNGLEHHIFPNAMPLLPNGSSSLMFCEQDRISRFLNVCKRDLEMVSVFCLYVHFNADADILILL